MSSIPHGLQDNKSATRVSVCCRGRSCKKALDEVYELYALEHT